MSFFPSQRIGVLELLPGRLFYSSYDLARAQRGITGLSSCTRHDWRRELTGISVDVEPHCGCGRQSCSGPRFSIC